MASADGNAQPVKDEMNAAPSLCSNGCGFFGNASTGGMCSKCYKETIAKQAASAPAASEAKPAVAPAAPTPAAAPAALAVAPAEAKPMQPAASSSAEPAAEAAAPAVGAVRPPAEAEPAEEPPKKVQVNTSRCWTCNRKIGLLGFQCKCEYYFCAEHRYSDRHECSFDFKEQGKKKLSKENPTIAPSKMESIN